MNVIPNKQAIINAPKNPETYRHPRYPDASIDKACPETKNKDHSVEVKPIILRSLISPIKGCIDDLLVRNA